MKCLAVLALVALLAHAMEDEECPEEEKQADDVVDAAPGPRKYLRPCYFTNWAQYRPGRGKYYPSEYIPGLCTHIMYAFGWMKEDYTVKAFDPADLDQSWARGMYNQVNDLKKKDPELKTMLSVGGWTFGTRLFKGMAASQETRIRFVQSALNFVRLHNFDGLDIDWEYPQGDEDIANFNELIKEVRLTFDEEAERSGRERLLITAAVSAGEGTINKGYNIPEIAKYFDFVLLMAYDFHGAWETVTGMNAPLYPRNDEIFWQKVWNIDWAANHWYEQGMPKEKIVIGVATYGRGWTLKDPASDRGLGAKSSGPAKATEFVREAGVASYYEFCEMIASGAERMWNEEHQVPYLVQGDQWFGYDDEESIRRKMQYIKDHGFGGAFVWTLDMDDFNGQCSNGNNKKYPLISIIKDELSGDYYPPPRVFEPMATTEPRTRRTYPTTVPPMTTKPPVVTGACAGKRDGYHKDPSSCRSFLLCLDGQRYSMSCPANLEYSSSLGYCVQKEKANCEGGVSPTGGGAVVSVTTTTAETATKEFTCPSDGFHRHPNCCTRFFRCITGVSHAFSCPGGTHFDPARAICVHPGETDCSGPSDC